MRHRAAIALGEDADKEGSDVQRRDATDHAVSIVIVRAASRVGEVAQERSQRAVRAKGHSIHWEVALLELRHEVFWMALICSFCCGAGTPSVNRMTEPGRFVCAVDAVSIVSACCKAS